MHSEDVIAQLHAMGFQDETLVQTLMHEGKLQEVVAGTYIADPGTPVDFVPLVLKGTLRVVRVDEAHDKELFLYFLREGSTCASTISCCMSSTVAHVEVVAEEDSTLFVLPLKRATEWFDSFPEWRRFVLQSYQQRFEEALQALDSVAFRQLDERLLNYLHERSKALNQTVLPLSHGDIATALHSSREVISRLLKKLENDGRLELGRNRITLLTD
jgi:CRP/FNR family transcriptional regulator